MSIDDGGPAFPGPHTPWEKGMTLRDWFAGQALSGIIAAYSGPQCDLPTFISATDRAYDYADATLEARKQA